MEKKVRNGLKNGSIFTQEASYLLTTLFRKWFSCEFLPLWSVNLLCIALDDSANQIAEGRVFLIDSEPYMFLWKIGAYTRLSVVLNQCPYL